MTAAELQSRLLARIGESSAPAYYTASEALYALNAAQRIFCFLTLCLETTAPLVLTAGQSWYHALATFPDWIVPLRLRVSGPGGAKLRPSGLTDLDALDESWQARAGVPSRYACVGCDLLATYPVQAGTLDVTYSRMPADMTALTSPEIPEEYHPALIDGAIPLLRAKEGAQELAKVQSLAQEFLAAAKKMAAFVRARNLALGYDRVPEQGKPDA